jgi:D-alanyl-D-alanine carboxypeptidase (penicillin-binding protein 5/6)
MNKAVRDLGFTNMRFVEPSGLSELNSVTAREYALFCRRYIELHPEAIAELHSLHFIEFPRAEHATEGFVPKGRIVQYNKNSMVLGYEGCDGLKTGYIVESGYNLAATAMRGPSRFVVVTLGGSDSGSFGGGASRRSHDGSALLDWCFSNFVTMKPSLPALGPVKAWFGNAKTLAVASNAALAVTLPKELASRLEARVVLPASLDAPIAAGQKIGEVIYSSGDRVLRRVDLLAAKELPRGNLLIQIRDFFAKGLSRIFGV